MDRGWHHTTCSGPERPRLGQQPYDRGRGALNDRRACFECGQDGHMWKFCPQLERRYCDSGRLMERSAGGGNGRWDHDFWPSTRIGSSVGKDHGYSRTDSREGSSSRRPHYDYRETVDFSQRPRDSGDRHRDNDGRGHGEIAALNARERDSKSGRSGSRKSADENHQAVGGHRGEERTDHRGKEGELSHEKLAANGDAPGQSPCHRVVVGGDDLRVQKAVQEDRPVLRLSGSEVEPGSNGSMTVGERCLGGPSLDEQAARQTSAGSQKEAEGSDSGRERCQINDSGGDRDPDCTPDQAARNRVPSRRHSSAKLPLSVLCKDAAEGNLERKHRPEKAVFSSASKGGAPGEHLISSSAQKLDAEDGRAEQGNSKSDSPSHRDEEVTVKGKNCEAIISPGYEQQVESEHTEEKDTGGGAACEHSEQTAYGSSGCDESQGKGNRVSRWGVGNEEAQARSFDKDEHIFVKLRDSVSDGAEDCKRDLPPGPADRDPESQLADLGFVEEGCHSLERKAFLLERDKLLHHSEDSTSGWGRDQGSLRESDDKPEWHLRGLEPDSHLRESKSDFRGRERRSDQIGEGIDVVSEKDLFWQRSDNMKSSGWGTPVRGRTHSRDRDNSHHSHTGLGSREGSVHRTSDRNGYTRDGARTGLKAEYRLDYYGGGYDKVGGRTGLVNSSDLGFGEDGGGYHEWSLDWRQPWIWESQPGHSLYRPGSYVMVCNARYLQLRRRSPMPMSPPSYNGVVPLDPLLPSSHIDDTENNTESQRKGWVYHESQGNLQGPVALSQMQDLQESETVQSDYMVQHKGSNYWGMLEHEQSPFKCTVSPSSLENKEPSVMASPRLCQASRQLHAPAGQEHFQEEQYTLENADQDICPPGTEACGVDHIDEDYEDFHIDERVEKLMDGRTLIPGKEKEIIHEALSIASRRVWQEYESDIAVEESPRSHGGFADMGDQWKDGDFGSDVQGLEGFGFDQPVIKVDAKAEEAGVEPGSEGCTEVASAPEPISRVHGTMHYRAESKQEPWKWPSRGGDWKVVYAVDNLQHVRGETQGSAEKGHAGYPKKVVMNGGRPLCGSKNTNLRDPRKHNQEYGRANVADMCRLQLPKFAQRALVSKVDNAAEDHHMNYSQHSVTVLKGIHSTTPKSQVSTPRAHGFAHRSVSVGPGADGLKMNRSGKGSSMQSFNTGSKSLSQVKQHQLLSKGSKVSNPAIKCESSGTVKNFGTVDNCGSPQFVASHDGQYPDHIVEGADRKSKPNLPYGSQQFPSPLHQQRQTSDLELSKCANATPLKKLLSSKNMPSQEDPDLKDGQDLVITSCNAVFSGGLHEGSDKFSQTKKDRLSVLPGLEVSMRNSVSVSSAQLHLSADLFTGEDSVQHENRVLTYCVMQANGRPCNNGASVMEVQGSDRPASIWQDTTAVDGELCRQKRKAMFVEDGQASKQHQKNSQRRRLSDYSNGDRKPAHSSLTSHVENSTMPPLIDDTPTKASDVDPLKERDPVEHRVLDQTWASLSPSILWKVFRSLRGDVKTLVNAMVTCKSWFAVGIKFKAELKQADLSSVQGHSLDAVLKSLPGFGGGKLRRIILKGCTVSPDSLSHLLRQCPSITVVEVDRNGLLKELICSFPNVKWLGDHNMVQSPRRRLAHKREDSHLKGRSLKVNGLRESSSRDGGESDMHPVSDSASKARSPGYTCVLSKVEEALINESIQDSGISHLTRGPNDGVKHLQLNNGGTIVKRNGISGSVKSVKEENGNSISRRQLKRKTLVGSSHRKLEKTSYRISKSVVGGQQMAADKQFSSSVRVEHVSKSTSMSLFEGDKTLEKEMGMMLRAMMDADTTKCFQSAHIVPTDSKGLTTITAKTPDLSMIEKKLKDGAYAGGKGGLTAFQDDVVHLYRTGFRNEKDRVRFSTAEKIFKLAHQHFTSLQNQISGTLPVDSSNQGTLPGARTFNKAGKSRLKNHSVLQHRPRPGKKRKAWDDGGLHKGKFGVLKKSRPGESSSGDVGSESDSMEHETRRLSKLKKEQRWESEGDSSEDDEEAAFMEEDEEETETEASDSDVPSESEGEDGVFEDDNCDTDDEQVGYHDWGARMTKSAMVPPVTRKYIAIEQYKIVVDKERVEQKMKVELPEDYEEKMQAAKEKRSDIYSHLDIPEMRDYKPRKKLGEEVLEQEVYGIDPYTHNLLYDTMPADIIGFSDSQKQQFIEEKLLLALNREANQYSGGVKAPTEYNLEKVVERIAMEADLEKSIALHDFSKQLLRNMRDRPKDKYVAYRKGLGVVCNKDNGLEKDEFVVEFFGEVYPPWRWYEKQDGIRSLQKKDKDTTPEFYNIFYERPKGDATGYDLLVVDAMHKANFASRLCHSCRPNCEAKITAVNNTYIIGVYTLKPIRHGEELTFDYNSVTESKDEYNNAVCLCGSQGCRGSYLNLTGSGTFEEVILKHHGLLDRHHLLLDSCTATSITVEEMQEMRQAGLGSCLLSGLPPWVLKYAASLVHFMNFEKAHLPAELQKDLELKLKQGVIEGWTEVDAEITTEGVYNQRLQNLAITLDKVRHILTEIYKNPSSAPPPLQKLDKLAMVQWIWKKDDSVVHELLQSLASHLPKETLSELKLGMSKHVPNDMGTNLRKSLLWLRDELRRLPATCKARHDAAADLIHIYAHTKNFFTMENYAVVESTPMNIHPLDLGSSRHSISVPRVWHKTYRKEYVWGQLIGWYKQSVSDPGASLAKAARGCLTLPDVSSCYAKSVQHDFRLGYGQKHRKKMIFHMEDKPQDKWPNSKSWSQIWSFKNERGLFGSPMLDSVLEGKPLDCEMVDWLKRREDVFEGPWDEQ